jgi:hypothetical protein
MKEQSDIQIEGGDIADRFEYILNPEERVFAKQKKLKDEEASHKRFSKALHAEETSVLNSRKLNAFDGLLHDKLGRKFDPNDGN